MVRLSLRGGWSDPAVRSLVSQATVVLLAGGVVAFLAINLIGNLQARGIRTGFGFLWQAASFEVGQSFLPYSAQSSFGMALLVGLLNTIFVAVLGVVLSTLLGGVIGVASLSRNPLVAPLARAYVEVVRNTPLLLQLYLWYAVLTVMLPMAARAPRLPLGIYLAKSGLHFPLLPAGLGLVAGALAAGILASLAAGYLIRRRGGEPAPGWRLALALGPALLALAGVLAVVPLDAPQPTRFGFTGGGQLSPELTALVIGLTLYNAAFVAEILRGGILSVPRGQTEAAAALGLRPGRILRLVVVPQALKVAVPPLASQYLSLTKNTSLAIGIGYPDLMSIGNTIINQTGQAVEVIALVMAVYLVLSLLISAFMNWYNARVALVGMAR